MNQSNVPSHILSEVYQAIAARAHVEPAGLDKSQVSETEFLAALAYVLSAPLIEQADVTETLLQDCQALVSGQELDVDGLLAYGFVPLTIKGKVLMIISSSPWDATTAEAANSYFPQVESVRCALASPKVLHSLCQRLKDASPANEPARAGYQPKAVPTPAATAVSPPRPAPSAPTVLSSPAPPTPGSLSSATVPPIAPGAGPGSRLNQEEVTHLVNLLVTEANRLSQNRPSKAL